MNYFLGFWESTDLQYAYNDPNNWELYNLAKLNG